MTRKHLIVVEHDGINILKSTYCAILASNNLSQDISALILAKDKETYQILSRQIEKYVGHVYGICEGLFEKSIAQSYALAIEHVVNNKGFNYVWAGSSSFMKETMPRVTARLKNASMISDIQSVISDDTFERPMWAGDIIAKAKMLSDIKVITVRPTDFQGSPQSIGKKSDVSEIAHKVAEISTKFVSFDAVKSDRPALSDASVIVSGGRGLKTPENFNNLIFPLADTLNAAVGASRAICDADWVPNDWQVGQTGKVVAPSLYFAIGISGAIQHVAGMRGSKVIVAINKDEEAPIFQVADYGLVGDALEILPVLTEKIKALL